MANPWEAEIEFSLDVARRLVASQFSELGPIEVEDYGRGWDNRAVRVNGEWIFRFPQRELARQTMEGELACLLALPEELPLAVPRPIHIGKPQADYPWPFAGYRELPGSTACSVPLTTDERTAFAKPLGGFLRALHGLELSAQGLEQIHGDRIQRADMKRRLEMLESRLAEIQTLPGDLDREAILHMARELAEAPAWDQAACVVHGDLYGRHLLVSDTNTLTGVIDWGDGHLGDPALDLSIAHTFLPAEARPIFEAAYGEIDAATLARSRYRAIIYGVLLLHYGEQIADEAMIGLGRQALIHVFVI